MPTDTINDQPNATLVLSVVGFGLPLPDVTWQRNGRDVANSVPPHVEIHNDVILQGGQKFIRSTLILALCNDTANRELIGEYTSVVRNDMRASQFRLNVTAPSTFVIILLLAIILNLIIISIFVQLFHPAPTSLKSCPPPSTYTLKVGESRSFTCDFYGYPWPNVTWTTNTSDSPITTRGRFSVHTYQVISNGYQFTRSVLEIHTAIENIEGVFICLASNSDNFSANATFTIDVIVPPKIIVAPTCLINMVAMPTINQTLVVTCVALGSPLPTLQWWAQTSTETKKLKNSTSVPVREEVKIHGGIEFVHSQLVLSGAEKQSDTTYSCTAANTASSKSSHFKICTIGIIPIRSRLPAGS